MNARSTLRAACLLTGLLVSAPQPGHAGEPASGVVVCDELVGLRRLMMQPDAAAHLPEHPGCRRVGPERIGAVARRAIIGGMPFECVALDGGACVWPLP